MFFMKDNVIANNFKEKKIKFFSIYFRKATIIFYKYKTKININKQKKNLLCFSWINEFQSDFSISSIKNLKVFSNELKSFS